MIPAEAATAIPRVNNQRQLEVCTSVSFSAFRPGHQPVRQHHSSLPPRAPFLCSRTGFMDHGASSSDHWLVIHPLCAWVVHGGARWWCPSTPRHASPYLCQDGSFSLCFFFLSPIPLPSWTARASFRSPSIPLGPWHGHPGCRSVRSQARNRHPSRQCVPVPTSHVETRALEVTEGKDHPAHFLISNPNPSQPEGRPRANGRLGSCWVCPG